MTTLVTVEAQIFWQLLFPGTQGVLEEPAEDFGGLLERMEAAELLALMEQVQQRLKELGTKPEMHGKLVAEALPSIELFIDSHYSIHLGSRNGPALSFRPLVNALFILFLRHPEGILLKHRAQYRQELEEIYSVISPATAKDDVIARVGRLVNQEDNSFSEKASVLNARLDELLPKGTSEYYKIQGYNGHPRRIPLNPLLVHWD